MLRERCDTATIIAAFAAGATRAVLAGPGTKWSDVREGLRKRDLGAVTSTALGAMVRITKPVRGHEQGYAGVRIVPSAAGLAVSGYRADGFTDYFKPGLALLQRDFRAGSQTELGAHDQLWCRSVDGSPIVLMIDGERVSGRSGERFSLARLALDLLATGNG